MPPKGTSASLYSARMDEPTFHLRDELVRRGYRVVLSPTAFEYKSPFIRVNHREIIGEQAIRAFFNLTTEEA